MEGTRLRIKVGDCEIELEGDPSFTGENAISLLSEAVEKISEFRRSGPRGFDSRDQESKIPTSHPSSLSISTIAAHLKPDGTQDLAMCAFAKVQIIDGEARASKDQIWSEMTSASGYFKSSMSKNFARDLSRMVRNKKINEVGSHVYALTASSRAELEDKLADIG